MFRFPKLIHVSQIRKHEWVTFHWIVSFLKQSSFESLQIPLIIRLVRAKEASFFSLNRIWRSRYQIVHYLNSFLESLWIEIVAIFYANVVSAWGICPGHRNLWEKRTFLTHSMLPNPNGTVLGENLSLGSTWSRLPPSSGIFTSLHCHLTSLWILPSQQWDSLTIVPFIYTMLYSLYRAFNPH